MRPGGPIPSIPPLRPFVCALGVALLSSGCVRVYQPMSGLHDPVIVDPTQPNFAGRRVTVRCDAGGLLSGNEAAGLCRKVGSLFENQGAEVRTGTTAAALRDEPFPPRESVDDDDPLRPDLAVVMRAERVHTATHPVSWLLSGITFTLVPGVTEQTFTHEVEVRDGQGFLLLTDDMTGRLVTYSGAGTWVGNKLLDWLLRDDDEKLTGEVANAELSADLYGRLSQLLFEAHLRERVQASAVSDP